MGSSKNLKIFSGNGNKDKIFFDLNLKNGLIPYNPKPTFLGIIFDEFICFKDHVVMLRQGFEDT